MKFKTVTGNGGIIKPESLSKALVGILRERKVGKFSPIYVIEDLEGKIHSVRGCTDLDSKLSCVQEGATVSIQFQKYANTPSGFQMVIMLVQVAVLEDEELSCEGPMESEHFVDYSKAMLDNIEMPEPKSKVGVPTSPDILARFRILGQK